MVGDLEIERRSDVHDRERAASVPGSGRVQGDQVIAAHEIGSILKFFDGVIFHDFAADGID